MPDPIFLLSPAFCGGRRAQLLLSETGNFDLARKIRAEGATLGEAFAFLSGLYFRGKLVYAKRFSQASSSACFVITPNRGLVSVDELVSLADLRAFADVPVDRDEPRYVEPLIESVLVLKESLDDSRPVILLGSIATDKYSGVLHPILASRLLFPTDFRGRGDMSRGALLLRAAASGNELAYESVPEIPRKQKRRARTSAAAPPRRTTSNPATPGSGASA